MAPRKKKRAAGSSQSQGEGSSGGSNPPVQRVAVGEVDRPFDEQYFQSREAYNIYVFMLPRPPIRERRIPHASGDQMRALGWGPFMSTICSASESLAREFHAHLRLRGEDGELLALQTRKVWCRGHYLPLTREDLNAMYSLPNRDFDFFTWAAQVNVVEMTKFLCGTEDVNWGFTTDGIHRRFLKTRLKAKYRCVFMFLIACLMPTLHEPHVTLLQAKLIYAIETGEEVDLGQILLHSFHYAAGEETGLGISLSSVIQHLWTTYGPRASFTYQDGIGLQEDLNDVLFRRYREPILPPTASAPPPPVEGEPSLGAILSSLQGLREDVARGNRERARESRRLAYRLGRLEFAHTHQSSLDSFPPYESPTRDDGAGTSRGAGGGNEEGAASDDPFDPSFFI